MNTVEIKNLTKTFGKTTALDNLSLNIEKGKITGLIGADGAGKTTLLRTITGLLIPDSGEISALGFNPVTQKDELTPLIGYMPQKFGLYEDLTVLENLILYADLKNVTHNFEKMLEFTKLARGQNADLLVITDGSEVNTANYVQSYALAIANSWLATSKYSHSANPPAINTEIRTWYNPDLNSHYFIVPGSIAITMTLIGILLTSLVVAREWERGTMEAMLSTSVKTIHIVLGKYIPYFILGMLSLTFNIFLCIVIFQIPFRGNYLVLLLVSGLFLFTSLGIGLNISSVLKNQFLASMVAMSVGFMPALMLSGLMFPINSMPVFFQHLTRILPPRYYVSFIESEFMAGTVPEIVIANAIYLTILGLILFAAVYKNTLTRLEKENTKHLKKKAAERRVNG